MVNNKLIARLAFLACLLTLAVMGLGAYTRLIDAGLGCPDWPGCYGHLTVPTTTDAINQAHIQYPATPLVSQKAWAEMVHRYFAGSLSLLFIVITGLVSYHRQLKNRRKLLVALTALLAVIIYQIILGRLTVTWQLLPVIVSQHLLGGMSILALFYLIHLLANSATPTLPQTPLLKYAFIVGLLLLLIQLALGAWTSTNYTALSCPDIPFCNNQQPWMSLDLKTAFNVWSPIGINYSGGILSQHIRQTIQTVHRLGALIVSGYLFILIIYCNVAGEKISKKYRTTLFLAALLTLQILLGMSNVVFKLPVIIAVSHNLVAGLLLLTLIKLIVV